ncbi:MAG: aminotransferase class I/II-fold pyridoxal phosphate-dependent enzyme [Acidobacteria bacterium]|nr:aminotransferase class I/II-fold pyridoxal phosphate-dependent enzyme [Acidobacteriota bacterium]
MTMPFEPFALERWQSVHEHTVGINLSESGVHPLRMRDLLGADDLEPLLDQRLEYSQTNGTIELRDRLATLYDGATRDDILVTNGGSEANFVACWRLIETGDEVVSIQPNYMQIPGLARAFGAGVREVWLRAESTGWTLDLDEVRASVTDRTRLIVVCNPNNPTGARLRETDVTGLCDIAAHHGCWLLADEIYRGAELDGRATPSVWGRYDRVLITAGLSKAYGLPGLRIGWIAGPSAIVDDLWARRDYMSIAPSALGDRLAQAALDPVRRGLLLARTRRILNRNQDIVAAWASTQPGVHYVPPEAGGVTLVRYTGTLGSAALAETLRSDHDVLVVPGSHFGLDYHVRLGIGGESEPLSQGLDRLGRALASQA